MLLLIGTDKLPTRSRKKGGQTKTYFKNLIFVEVDRGYSGSTFPVSEGWVSPVLSNFLITPATSD